MKGFLLGLMALLLRGVGILLMIVAYVVVSVAGWIEAATEWADRMRGIPIVQVGEDEQIDSQPLCDNYACFAPSVYTEVPGRGGATHRRFNLCRDHYLIHINGHGQRVKPGAGAAHNVEHT